MGWRARKAGVVAAALALSGCWFAPGQGPNRAGYNPFEDQITVETVADLELAWTASTDDAGVQGPVVSNTGVHVRAGLSYYGFSPVTGARQWKHTRGDPSAPILLSDPITDGKRLLVSHGLGNLGGHYSSDWLDAATGAPLGITTTAGLADSLRGSAAAFRFIGFGTFTPILTELEIHDFDDPAASWGGPILIGDQRAGSTVTLGSDGAFQAGYGVVSMTDPAAPALGNGVRSYPRSDPVACGPQGFLRCPTWATPLAGATSTVPVLGPGESVLYTATDAGNVHAVDTASGAVLWSAPLGADPSATPALAEGLLYVPTVDGRLVAFDADGCGAATCAPLWDVSGSEGARISQQPAVAGGVVYTGWSDGAVRAHAAAGCGSATCPELWSANTGSMITGAPAVTGGQLYVGTSDGRLVAYGLP